MLHHTSLPVANLERARDLYASALDELGYQVVCEGEDFVGFGIELGKDKFVIKLSTTPGSLGPQGHLAFSATSRAAVDAFHKTAVDKGAIDNGAPGLRRHYGPDYYASFIVDFDGHHIEAVFNARADSDA